jgi:hypothetical protein
MKMAHEPAVVQALKIVAWVSLGLVAILSWVVISADIEVWSALLSPGYAFERYVCIFLLVVGLGGPFSGGLVYGLKILVLASDFGFFAALLRGYFSSHFGQDCADFCFGILNRVLGLGCGSAGEGCAFEAYLLAFFAVEFIFLLGYIRIQLFQKSK